MFILEGLFDGLDLEQKLENYFDFLNFKKNFICAEILFKYDRKRQRKILQKKFRKKKVSYNLFKMLNELL